MRPLHVLLLSLAATSAIANAERGMRYTPDVPDDDTSIPQEPELEIKSDTVTGLIAALSEQFQQSSETLLTLLGFDEADDVARIVIIEEEEEDPAVERKTACLKAMEIIHEQEELELEQETETLMKYIRSAVDMVSLQIWGGPSCNDLDRSELVDQCNLVLKSEDVVQLYLVEGKTDDQVCDVMSVVTDLDTKNNNLSCQLCQRFVQMVDQALSQEVQQVEQVREIIGDLCDAMATDSMCHTFLKNYDAIVDWVKHGTDSLVVCSRLAMCSADSNSSGSKISDLTWTPKELPTVEDGALVTADFQEQAALDLPLMHDNDKACVYCDAATTVVEVILQEDPEQINAIREYADMICGVLGDDSPCHQYVSQLDTVFDSLNKGVHPHEICKMLKYCSTKRVNSPSQSDTQNGEENASSIADDFRGVAVASQWPLGNESQCTYCQFATTAAKIALQQYGADIREVRAYADMICDVLGEDNPCHVYMKQFDFVIDSITKGMTSKAICEGLKFCAATIADDKENALASSSSPASAVNDLTADVVAKDSMEESSDSCFVCTQVASVLQVAVAEDPSQIAQIRQIADVVCSLIPSDNQWRSFVKKFDAVVGSLQKGEQPEAICHDLQYCTADSNPAMANLAVPDMIAVQNHEKGGSTCAYCNGVVTVLKYALGQKPDQVKEMREAAGFVCQLLPADDTCHDNLKMFDEALNDVLSGKEPQEICQTLKFCAPIDTGSEVLSGLPDVNGKDFMPTRCTACQQNRLLLAFMITHPDNLDTFKREINSLCRLIPEYNECKLLMKHQDAIIDSLKKEEDVVTICTRIAECAPVAEEVQEEKSMSAGCLFCEFTADLLGYAKDSEMALREAKATIETICTVRQPLARCDVLSSKFDELLSLMREGKSPSEACHGIALCDENFVSSPTPDMKEDPVVQAFEKARQSMSDAMEIQ